MPVPRVTPKNLTDQFPLTDANMTLGDHEFYVNPHSFRKDAPNIIYKNVTKGGIYLQTYVADIITYSMIGTYSNAGISELKKATQYAPQFSKKIQPYNFVFHPLNISGISVLVADYKVSFEDNDAWYIHYELTLQEVPLAKTTTTVQVPVPHINFSPARLW